jgi:hypothetical protein
MLIIKLSFFTERQSRCVTVPFPLVRLQPTFNLWVSSVNTNRGTPPRAQRKEQPEYYSTTPFSSATVRGGGIRFHRSQKIRRHDATAQTLICPKKNRNVFS